jgi:Anthranilate phosphoribosyltransferase
MMSKSSPNIFTQDRFKLRLRKQDLQLLYSDRPYTAKRELLKQLGPLESVFDSFVRHEQNLQPLDKTELASLFDLCSDNQKSAGELLELLWLLAPGNGRIGFRQVNYLVDHLRTRIDRFLLENDCHLDLVRHDHAFGSGGDFWKTGHATTNASIVTAPILPICKTGTSNVTAEHGSYQATREIGYDNFDLDSKRLNRQLTEHGFAFIPLSSLGFPYSDALKTARNYLWQEALNTLCEEFRLGKGSWPEVVRNTDVPLDIFKIVSPNAQVLNPANHSTGVCHLKMLPYVLAIYLHLGSTGLIAHCYEGIDEVSNASSSLTENNFNNLVINVQPDEITFIEFSPEDVGFKRVALSEIEEDRSLTSDASTFWKILAGVDKSPKRDFVLINSALLLVAGHKITGTSDDILSQISAGARLAGHLIDSGISYNNFKGLLGAL